ALLEDAQAIAHHHDLAEEAVDRNHLLLRARAPGSEHELAALPTVGEDARRRLLGVENRAHALHDFTDVGVVEHGSTPPAPSQSRGRACGNWAGQRRDEPRRSAMKREAVVPQCTTLSAMPGASAAIFSSVAAPGGTAISTRRKRAAAKIAHTTHAG